MRPATGRSRLHCPCTGLPHGVCCRHTCHVPSGAHLLCLSQRCTRRSNMLQSRVLLIKVNQACLSLSACQTRHRPLGQTTVQRWTSLTPYSLLSIRASIYMHSLHITVAKWELHQLCIFVALTRQCLACWVEQQDPSTLAAFCYPVHRLREAVGLLQRPQLCLNGLFRVPTLSETVTDHQSCRALLPNAYFTRVAMLEREDRFCFPRGLCCAITCIHFLTKMGPHS